MTRKKMQRAAAGLAAAVTVAATSGHVDAMPIDLGDDWEANWDTTLSVGAEWRATNPDKKLYVAGNGARVGLSGGLGGTSSDANTLNTRNGDLVSDLYKVVSDFEVKHDDMGALLRAKAWYDQALKNETARYGNEANGYATNSRLSDEGLEPLQRFDGAQLLDAYVYNTFDVGGKSLQLRLGHQVINWGESLFVQGVNQINPLDIPALRHPATELKEGLLPVWAAYGNLGLGGGVSVEGFYQFAWEPTTVDACGSYWSSVDTNIGTNPGACNKIVVGLLPANEAIASGIYAPLVRGHDARNTGEGGAAVKIPVDAIDTEFGLYAMNVNSRTPIISARTGSWGNANAIQQGYLGGTLNPLMAAQVNQALLGASGVKVASAYWEYPNDIQYYGISAATNLAGWSIGAEASVTPNLPVQRNGNDLLNGMLTGTGPLGGVFRNTASLNDVRGYDRFRKTQFQVNGIKVMGGVLGATKSTVLGETAFEWINVPDYHNGTSVRYGRSFIFGTASSAGNNTCSAAINPQPDGCQNDGFVTDFAWGYRLRGALEYPQIFGTGFTFTPSLSLAHDVQGVSADNQFIEGRLQTGVTMRFSYENKYNVDLGYVYFAKWAKYDPLRDHDFYSLTLSATF